MGNDNDDNGESKSQIPKPVAWGIDREKISCATPSLLSFHMRGISQHTLIIENVSRSISSQLVGRWLCELTGSALLVRVVSADAGS